MKLINLCHLVIAFFFSHTLFADVPVTTIRFATEATYPPFEMMDESGQMKGFDIDIAKALCQEINAKCTFSNQPFNSLIPSLQLGKFDALIGAIGVTPERQKQVAFTESYYEPSGSFVAPLAKHETLNTILGKTVGVQTGTTLERYLHDKYANKIKIKSYASIQDAFLDLVSGRVDMVMADTPIAQTWLKADNNTHSYGVIDKPIIDHVYFGSGYAIAVRQDDPALLQSLNQALTTIKANGTYAKIANTYFGGK